jgi:5'-3' exonuclease
MQEFAGILKEFGCIISEINGCEGDDLMYYWANKLYEDGEDVVIITGDGDINQLTKHNDNNFIVVYNIKSTDRKIVASPGFDEFLADDSVSLFDSFSYMGNNKDVIKTIIDANKLSIVDPKDVLFDKILMGDAGDNVPPILSWQETQKSGRIINRSITTAKLERVKELLEMRGIELDVTKMEEHAKVISQQIKIIYDKEITEEMTANRIKRNTKLVYLSDETIPIEYRNLFEKHYSENKANGYPKIERWDMHTLLGKTKYGQTTNAFESDVFKTFKSAKPKVREDEPDNTSKKLF